MNTTVIYYDTASPAEELQKVVDNMRKVLTDTTIIAIPKDYDLMLDCSIDQLVTVRSIVDTAIQLKMENDTDALHMIGDSGLPLS